MAVAGWGFQSSVLEEPLRRLGNGVRFYSLQDLAQQEEVTSSANDGSSFTPETKPSKLAVALIEELGPQRCDIIGWSSGALLALELAIFWPDRVRRLVLCSATCSFCMRSDYAFGVEASRVRAMRRQLGQNPAKVVSNFVRQLGGELERHQVEIQGEIDVSALRTGLDYLLNTDLRALLDTVVAPTLLLHGTLDSVVPSDASGYVCGRLPNSRLKLLGGAGHCFWQGHIAEIATSIEDFLLNEPLT